MNGRSATLAVYVVLALISIHCPWAMAQSDHASAQAVPPLPPHGRRFVNRPEELRAKHGVTALLVGVGIGGGASLVAAAGTSMTGVPARTDMHFRMGAMAIASQTTILMQLVDEGRVKPRRHHRQVAARVPEGECNHPAHAGGQHLWLCGL